MSDEMIFTSDTPEEEEKRPMEMSSAGGADSRTESGRDSRSDGDEDGDADDEDEGDDDDDSGTEQQDSEQEQIEMEEVCVKAVPERSHPAWIDELNSPEDSHCVEVMRVCVCVTAAAVMFPLLTWGGFKLLPFTPPSLESPALRLLYTLRCAFFATIPIVLGVLVEGVSRLKYRTLNPLFKGTWEIREVVVHTRFVRDSLHLHLLYFLQLAVAATYAQQEMLKLVPLLTIIFVLGRLIYWICAAFSSSVRALGFALSFLPLLVLLAANLYFIGSVSGREAVFNVAPPTTPPPPKQRWWG